MADQFLAEIRIFPLNFAPRGWAFCDGQIMAISQNAALFSLLGTTYGGDGRTTFALPNLQGRAPLHVGQGPGLSNYALGEASGTTQVSLLPTELPTHSHTMTLFSLSEGTERSPENQLAAANAGGLLLYALNPAPAAPVMLNPAAVTPVGGSQPHNNMMPYLALNFCIALQGIYPSRS